MSEISRGLDNSAEHEIVGPDYFGFYAHVVAGLLAEIKPGINGWKTTTNTNTGSITVNQDINGGVPLFSNALETWVSDLKNERLKSVLRQSVVALSQEVDEMLEPISSVCRIKAILRHKKSLATVTSTAGDTDDGQPPLKKIKVSTSSQDSETKKVDIIVPGKEMPNRVVKKCFMCSATELSESLCDACSSRLEQQREHPPVNSDFGVKIEDEEDSDDLQFLLGSDVSEVEEIMKKHSDELLMTIKHMENMLDKILDIVMANCRPMSRIEKQELKKLIQNLPARNLDRIVEILQRARPQGKISCGEVHVDLEKEDTITLWRLYYYVQTVESAKNLRKGQ